MQTGDENKEKYQILQTNIMESFGRQWGVLLMRSWEFKGEHLFLKFRVFLIVTQPVLF